MEIVKFQSRTEAATAAGEALNILLNSEPEPILLLLSGGSAFLLPDYVSHLNSKISITMLDERFSQDPGLNNFSKLQQTDFYKIAQDNEVNFFGTLPRPGESMEIFAKRLESKIKEWTLNNPKGKIFATFGMGADGHTAGIFPFESEIEFKQKFESKNWFTAYNAGPSATCPLRVTATYTFFKKIDAAIVYITGQEKKPKFDEYLKANAPLFILPILGINYCIKTSIYTDL